MFSLCRLIIAGIIGIALFFAVMALADILFRQYFLTVNVFNFDAQHEWKSLGWYSDNADISNGEWKNETIPKFAPAGTYVCSWSSRRMLGLIFEQALV